MLQQQGPRTTITTAPPHGPDLKTTTSTEAATAATILERKNARRKAKCHAMATSYQKAFTKRFGIPSLSSEQLLQLTCSCCSSCCCCKNEDKNITTTTRATVVILVDARSTAERAASVIPGAISVQEFESQHVKNLSSLLYDSTAHDKVSATKDNYMVVTYCTIGYRSGYEAVRLQRQYPALKGKIYNLDGIVAYTHAVAAHNEKHHPKQSCNSCQKSATAENEDTTTRAAESEDYPTSSLSEQQHKQEELATRKTQQEVERKILRKCSSSSISLIDPVTGEPATAIHTFAFLWNLIPMTAAAADNNDNPNNKHNHKHLPLYRVKMFTLTVPFRMALVGWNGFYQTIQHWIHTASWRRQKNHNNHNNNDDKAAKMQS